MVQWSGHESFTLVVRVRSSCGTLNSGIAAVPRLKIARCKSAADGMVWDHADGGSSPLTWTTRCRDSAGAVTAPTAPPQGRPPCAICRGCTHWRVPAERRDDPASSSRPGREAPGHEPTRTLFDGDHSLMGKRSTVTRSIGVRSSLVSPFHPCGFGVTVASRVSTPRVRVRIP